MPKFKVDCLIKFSECQDVKQLVTNMFIPGLVFEQLWPIGRCGACKDSSLVPLCSNRSPVLLCLINLAVLSANKLATKADHTHVALSRSLHFTKRFTHFLQPLRWGECKWLSTFPFSCLVVLEFGAASVHHILPPGWPIGIISPSGIASFTGRKVSALFAHFRHFGCP